MIAGVLIAGLAAAAPAMPIDLSRPCIEAKGDAAVAGALLQRRLTERGALAGRADACSATIRFRQKAGTGEGFRIERTGATALTVSAAQRRGHVYAAGWLLRRSDGLSLAMTAAISDSPVQPVRGTQIGYRFKNNSYDAWTPAMLERRIEDFALWGANRIQIVAPVSDDAATSPLSPVPAGQAVRAMAEASDRLGLDAAIFYPLLGDYDGGAADDAEVARFDALMASLPALDAVYLPGGDPGHTSPERLFPLAKRLAGAMRRRFPGAELLISTQGFDAARLDTFFRQTDARPDWLSAVFVGPQTRITAAEHIRRLAGRFPVELYPDTAHAMHAQLPVLNWHPAFALTQGREPVNPRPAAMAAAFAAMTPGTRGAVTYSEGVNDDWNVHHWLAMGWNPAVDGATVAADYARMFVGDPAFADIPARLEGNWRGDPAGNTGIDETLTRIDALKPAQWADWRIDLYRYRAVYDALVRHRLGAADARQAEALYSLRQVQAIGAEAAVAAARAAYARPEPGIVAPLRARLDQLAEALWRSARMQLSVARYGASNWERGANLDRADIDLNDRQAVEADLTAAMAQPEPERSAAILAIGDRWGMGQLALYDDLGDPDAEPHLVRGPGYPADPQGFASAIDGVADAVPGAKWRMAQLSYAEALFEHPLTLRYAGLERDRRYRLRYSWAGEDYALPLRLMANGKELIPFMPRKTNPQLVDIDLPLDATADGELTLEWHRPPGIGGGGRGRQIAEVWLIPQSRNPDQGAEP